IPPQIPTPRADLALLRFQLHLERVPVASHGEPSPAGATHCNRPRSVAAELALLFGTCRQIAIDNQQSTIPRAYNRWMDALEHPRRLTTGDVKSEAKVAGFDLCGVAPAADFPEPNFLTQWLARGYAGEMHYLQRTAERRANVRAVMPSAQSVI